MHRALRNPLAGVSIGYTKRVEAPTAQALLRSLQSELNTYLRPVDLDALSRRERELVADLKGVGIEVRLALREYEAAETLEARRTAAMAFYDRLEKLQQQLLEAGNANILGPADIAVTSAYTEQLMARI